ncbi:MAG: hypothetical protein CVV02_05705 [Firmicutes bacterium HGW-Firmicutes-7]|nr:MAG: hypothetical protein CVV02_05705 [Firmicutes bacterium HGW-Firmicutes-7]
MKDFTINYAMREPLVDFEVYFSESYRTVFDLSSSLVNLQALISGITRAYEDNQQYFIDEKIKLDGLINNEENKVYKRIRELRNILDVEFKDIDVKKRIEISEKISSFESDQRKLAANKKESTQVRPYATTSASFASNYKDLVVLNRFEQGSLFLDIVSSVLAGIILKFVERLLFAEGNNSMRVNVSRSTLIILKDGKPTKIIRLDKESGTDFERISNEAIPLDEYYNKLLDEIKINPNNIEESVENLFAKLEKEKLFSPLETYNRKGIKTVVNDTKRIIDIRG